MNLVDTGIRQALFEIQSFAGLAFAAGVRAFRSPFYHREFITQLDRIGVNSLFIISLTGLFTGMVMALQALTQLRPFAATSYVGGMVAVSMVKELGPVLSSLMVTGRVGSAISAELGTMVVTEQIDAMRVEGTDIIQRLVTPRLKATLVAMPLLTFIADAISLAGGYLMAGNYGINPVMYWNSLTRFMKPLDLLEGAVKPACFGVILCLVACQVGLATRGGAEAVGASAKRAVVLGSVLILVADFFLTKLFIAFR